MNEKHKDQNWRMGTQSKHPGSEMIQWHDNNVQRRKAHGRYRSVVLPQPARTHNHMH